MGAAYKSSFYAGRDPVTAAAEAYISASEADSPCASAAKAYFGAVNSGSNADSAALAASKAFASATAAAAYASASAIPSPAGNAALNAFVAKALETGNGFDAGCASAADKFIESYSSGETVARLAAAREYISLYASNPTSAKDSPPCRCPGIC